MGSSKKVKIGYKYFLGLHIAICRGPVNRLKKILVGDKVAWEGDVTGNTEFHLNQPNLFGGEKSEGGIQGPVAVLMGAPDQGVHARLAAMLGGLVPAFRGVLTLFYDGLVSSMTPYLKPWAFRVARTTAGWQGDACWYPAKCEIVLADADGAPVHAMNPAHILWQIYTDARLSRGLPPSRLDDAAFRAAADALAAEGFGLCLAWAKKDRVQSFAQSVVDHIGATIFTDRHTGLLSLKLIRDDYDPMSLPLYTVDSGLIGVDEDEASALAGAVNEVIVNYVDPSDGKPRSVRVKNMAGIMASGAVVSTTQDYPGIPTRELATKVALRDLRALAGGLRSMKLRFDRRAAHLMPGDLFRIALPERGIADMVMRAGRCEYGEGTDGTVTITASQDVFGLPATVYVRDETPGYAPPDTTPQPIAVTDSRLLELSCLDLYANQEGFDAAAMDALSGHLIALARRPTAATMSFDPLARPGNSGAFVEAGTMGGCDFTGTATLAAAISPTTTGVFVAALTDVDGFETPGLALLVSATSEELVRVEAINAATGAVTLARGVADTVPQAHPAGATLWFYGSDGGWLAPEYVQGMTVQARLLSVTGAGRLPEAAAPILSATVRGRAGRPYPPGNLRINGQRYPATITGALSLTWSHRDRITQAEVMVDTLQGNIGPEPGVSYTLRLFAGPDARHLSLKKTVADLTGVSYAWSTEAADSGLAAGALNPVVRVALFAVRDGIESLQSHDWTVTRS